MSEQEKQENQKTIVAFAAGLLIGGLLVWIFGGSTKTEQAQNPLASTSAPVTQQVSTSSTDTTTSTDESAKPSTSTKPQEVMQTGEGKIEVSNQKAGLTVKLDSATFPSDDGWVGVRDYVNGQPGSILGVVRFSKSQGLVPESIELQRATTPGDTYAVVFYSDNGDKVFNLATDSQIGGVLATFTAQ